MEIMEIIGEGSVPVPRRGSRSFLSRCLGSAVFVSILNQNYLEQIVKIVCMSYPVRTKLYNIRLPIRVLPKLCMRDSAAEGISIL
jgi:hypothetical protein